MRCPNCGGVIFVNEVCKICGTGFKIKPRFEPLNKVDIFKLARLLKEKEEKEKGKTLGGKG